MERWLTRGLWIESHRGHRGKTCSTGAIRLIYISIITLLSFVELLVSNPIGSALFGGPFSYAALSKIAFYQSRKLLYTTLIPY